MSFIFGSHQSKQEAAEVLGVAKKSDGFGTVYIDLVMAHTNLMESCMASLSRLLRKEISTWAITAEHRK